MSKLDVLKFSFLFIFIFLGNKNLSVSKDWRTFIIHKCRWNLHEISVLPLSWSSSYIISIKSHVSEKEKKRDWWCFDVKKNFSLYWNLSNNFFFYKKKNINTNGNVLYSLHKGFLDLHLKRDVNLISFHFILIIFFL